jgi:hypothetical protein
VNTPAHLALPAPFFVLLESVLDQLQHRAPKREVVRRFVSALSALPPSDINLVYSAFAWSHYDWFHLARPRWIHRVFGGLFRSAPPALTPLSYREVAIAQMRHAPELATLFLFSANGYVRESALARIQTADSAFVLAAIAYRLNDWAAPVRRAATGCTKRVFAQADPEVVAEAALFLLDRKSHWRRTDADAVVLDQAFARPDVVTCLIGRIATEQTAVVHQVFTHVLMSGLVDDRLLAIAQEASSAAVRATAFRTLIDGQATRRMGYDRQWIDKSFNISRRIPKFQSRPIERPAPLDRILELAARDRSAAVRRIAADGLVRHRRAVVDVDGLARLLREDRSRAIRQRIAFIDEDLGLETVAASGSKAP